MDKSNVIVKLAAHRAVGLDLSIEILKSVAYMASFIRYHWIYPINSVRRSLDIGRADAQSRYFSYFPLQLLSAFSQPSV
ncbi:hypothetical protein [Paenibacillus marchantiophytorum]|uniref:hypothetical protein n=1 Tax=Paenibacillus marchantiophytorum TaxID=1619310 RepID=UPI001668ECCD|nr:hypothetical protein [Paenibacillus marchantiophytorum]